MSNNNQFGTKTKKKKRRKSELEKQSEQSETYLEKQTNFDELRKYGKSHREFITKNLK